MVSELVEAAEDEQLSKTINRCGRVDLLCQDELGYMELDLRGVELLFQVPPEREERLRSGDRLQRSLQRLDQDLHRPRLCAAIVDRLTFSKAIIETGITSYGLANARTARAKAG